MIANTDQSKPQALFVRPQNIPRVVRDIPHWVVWRYTQQRTEEEVRWTKPLFDPRTGKKAKSTDPATWSDFGTALQTYQKGGWDGIGFVLQRDDDSKPGFVAVDLDKCRNSETGELKPWAKEVIVELNTYTEVSPSGRGLRIFLLGKLPPEGRRKGEFEVYETARYMTVTGEHLGQTPRTVELRQVELEKVHRRFFAPKEQKVELPHASASLEISDQELIRKAKSAKNGAKFTRLWEGEWKGYASQSEADLALCCKLAFYCGPDEERISSLFSQSGLYRDKWKREDYRGGTIGKALELQTEFYDPSKRSSMSNECVLPPSDVRAAAPSEQTPHLTDTGNAIRLVRNYGEDIRYCHVWKKWLCWDGKKWRNDKTGEINRRAKQVVSALYAEGQTMIDQIQAEFEESEA